MARMNPVKHYLTTLLIIIGLGFSSTAIAAEQLQHLTTIQNSEHFRVSYKSNIEPLPLNRIHSWVLHVDTLISGSPVENASISIQGGMPAHKHGLPTQPVVTKMGNGDYLVEGLKFSMTGTWQIRFNIRSENLNDEIKFLIEL